MREQIITAFVTLTLFAAGAGYTSAQAAEPATPSTSSPRIAPPAVSEEEKQKWIEERLATFESIIADELKAREQLAKGIDEIATKNPSDRKSTCDATDFLLADHMKMLAKLDQMIADLERFKDKLTEIQVSRLLACKTKMPEIMSKVRGCENKP